jgi:hypothetical protein
MNAMTSAVGFASQLVYIPQASTPGAPAEDQAQTAAPTVAATPVASAATDGALLAPSTVSALVAEQSAPAAAAAAEPSDAASSEHTSPYEVYMPTRDGFSSHALAVGVEDPNAVSSSAGKNDEEIATDARARLDANYAKMTDSGQPFDYNSWEGVDMDSLFGDLDPKSLTAVQDNRGGLFSDQEQTLAKMFLGVQASFRAGGYSGPTRLMGQFMASGLSHRPSADADAEMKAWDADAAKKPTDVGTQLGRAAMRVLLGPSASVNLFGDSKSAMLSLLVDALQKAQADDPHVLDKLGNIRTAQDLEKQDWFKGHVQQLQAILQGMADTTGADSTADATGDTTTTDESAATMPVPAS